MGSLAVPMGGVIYLDAQSIIYSVERHPVYSSLLRPLWVALNAGQVAVVSSQLSLLECLVLPLRNQNAQLIANFESVFQSSGIRLIPIGEAVLRQAATIRASWKSQRTPDAIHTATAILEQVDLFLTNDHGFRSVSGLRVSILDDLLASP